MAKGKKLTALRLQTTAKKTEIKKQNIVTSGKGKIMRGLVLVAKLPKTATVLVEYRKTHPLYGKSFRRSKKYLVHDEVGVSVGDIVEIHQIRPISKNKHFAVVKVTGQNIEAIVTGQLKEEAAEVIASIMPEKVEESSDVSHQTEKISKKEEKPKKERKSLKAKS